MADNGSSEPQCSFCGKAHHEVARLISGPDGYICDRCIRVCHGILIRELGKERAQPIHQRRGQPDMKRLESEVDLLLQLKANEEITEEVFKDRMAQATVDAFLSED